MTVTSTPPNPAESSAAISRVRFRSSTALPSHHHRVHGFASDVIAGHSRMERGVGRWPCAGIADPKAARAATIPSVARTLRARLTAAPCSQRTTQELERADEVHFVPSLVHLVAESLGNTVHPIDLA